MMKLSVVTAFAVVLFSLVSCGGGNKKADDKKETKGGIKYGGVFRYNETEFLKSLYPLGITEVVGHHIVSQVYEGLVEFDPKTLLVQPLLAESWSVDSTMTVYTFKIRKGVLFHDDACFKDGKGREVTARDFEYCFSLLCKQGSKNQGYTYFEDVIKGAQIYNADGKLSKPEGVVAVDDYTFQVTLEKPYADFLQKLALPFCYVFPKEAVDYHKDNIIYHTVGTGPFVLSALKENDAVVLARNKNYWKKDANGNSLPYLDGVKVSFIKEDKTEMMAFTKSNLEMKYRLPFSMIEEILDENRQLKGEYKKFVLVSNPQYSVQFYGFLIPNNIFKNKDVRLAFNYAIDRASIANYTAKGEGIEAKYGFIPLAMPGYDNAQIKGYTFDVKKAKEHLSKAGYPDGKGFPRVTLEINSGGGRNEDIAVAIKKMLTENLNIEVEISQVVWAQHTSNVETGKTNFWRFGWVADYPDPINFLNLFYGKNIPKTMAEASYSNPCRYSNPRFDELYEKVRVTTDSVQRNNLYAQLDQIIIDDAPILPIYYSVNRKLFQPYVKNYFDNGMDYRSVREVWLDK